MIDTPDKQDTSQLKRENEDNAEDKEVNKMQKTESSSEPDPLTSILGDSIADFPLKTNETEGDVAIKNEDLDFDLDLDLDGLQRDILSNADKNEVATRDGTPADNSSTSLRRDAHTPSRVPTPQIDVTGNSNINATTKNIALQDKGTGLSVKTATTTPLKKNNIYQHPQGIQGLNTASIDRPQSAVVPPSSQKQEDYHTNDPSKLNDALAAAGVNIQQEEDLLQQTRNARRFDINNDPSSHSLRQRNLTFLNHYHIALFMSKVARENGFLQNFYNDLELLESVSAACENWLAGILTKTIALSRHRRRGVPSIGSKGQKSASLPRSALSRELRNIAVRQKEQEEKRVARRTALGLETNESEVSESANNKGKAGAEETLHRAANATAAMKTSSSKKKYAWMQQGSGTADDSRFTSDKNGAGKQSPIIYARGDNGLRFKEIRSSNTITLRDLLGVIEDERMGSEKALVKGYAKLKD